MPPSLDAIFTPDTPRELEELRLYAEKPENLYVWGALPFPGDKPEHVRMILPDLRIVFSLTRPEDVEGIWRMLTISRPLVQRLPTAPAAIPIARMLGFTGSPEAWDIEIFEEVGIVCMSQLVETK